MNLEHQPQLRSADSVEAEPATTGLQREAQVLMAGIGGFGQAAVDAFADHPVETGFKVAAGIAMGCAIARFAPVRGAAGALVRSAEGAAVGSFAMDLVQNGAAVGHAMADAFGPNADLAKDMDVMRKVGGQFLFDTALMTAASVPFASKLSQLELRRNPLADHIAKWEGTGPVAPRLEQLIHDPAHRWSLETMMGLASAEREIATAEAAAGFLGSRRQYDDVADALQKLSLSTDGDFQKAYLSVTKLVRKHASLQSEL